MSVGSGQKTWKTIDSALRQRKASKSTPASISVDSKLCTNKTKYIANEYNNYFAIICANNEIPDINTYFISYLDNCNRNDKLNPD